MLKLCTVLDLLYVSNKINRRISYKEFYNEIVNTDKEYKKVRIFRLRSNLDIETNKEVVH